MSQITQAVAGAPAQNGAAANLPPGKAIVRRYYKQLSALLPSHVRAENWYSSALAALDKSADLADAANRNPESLMYALFESARLGLPPGTELYYLTPRPNKRAKGGKEVLGMVGYRGDIELIYNAGHVASVVVEIVRENDIYRYRRGVDRTPVHDFEPFARNETRGELKGVYAYGEMISGAVSRVVELNQDDIDRAMSSSPTANSTYSPWKTDKATMWLKTGVHRLRKFVPSSAERAFTSMTMRATAEAVGQAHGDDARRSLTGAGPAGQIAGPAAGGQLLPGNTTVVPAGEPEPSPISYTPAPPDDEPPLSQDQFAQPPAPEDDQAAADGPDPNAESTAAQQPDAPVLVTEFTAPPSRGDDPPATQTQTKAIGSILGRDGFGDDDKRFAIVSRMVARPRPVGALTELTKPEASRVMDLLSQWGDANVRPQQLAAVLTAARADEAANLPAPGTPEWHRDGHPTEALDGTIQRADRADGECSICEDAAIEAAQQDEAGDR